MPVISETATYLPNSTKQIQRISARLPAPGHQADGFIQHMQSSIYPGWLCRAVSQSVQEKDAGCLPGLLLSAGLV